MRIGIYPGSFDPITYGHLDVVRRSSTSIVDKLFVSVARGGKTKQSLIDWNRRCELCKQALEEVLPNDVRQVVEVVGFDDLLVDHAQSLGARVIIRGLRAISDFDYEFSLTSINTKLDKNIETVFLMASEKYHFISSSQVKELAAYGGDITHFVPKCVSDLLKIKAKS